MEDNLHVGGKESEERGHSVGGDFTLVSGVEVVPGLGEVFVKVVLGSFTLQFQVGLQDFQGGHSSGDWVEVEVSGWHASLFIGSLHGVVRDHGVHELVITGTSSIEVVWDNSVVTPDAIVTRLGDEKISLSLNFNSGDAQNKKCSDELFHFLYVNNILL